MAKVGILTFHHANNYGAVLQAYGLAQAIAILGHEVEVLDYRPAAARKVYGQWPRHPLRAVPYLVKRWRFDTFRRRHLPLSRRTYWASDDLSRHPPNVDAVICGSDQVWNIASFRGFDPVFFLEFLGEPGPRRISYAATFGHTEDLGVHRERIQRLLSRFDYLSVRDVDGQVMIRNLIDHRAEHVLDPSFLADYSAITPPRTSARPYVLVYCMTRTDLIQKAVKMLRQKLRMPVISIGTGFEEARVVRAAGPLQWLGLVHHAAYVCTNSFHGLCFAMINRKDFTVLPNEGRLSRLRDLLQTTHLPDKLAENENELEISLASPIDYGVVSAQLQEARRRSQAFLRTALP